MTEADLLAGRRVSSVRPVWQGMTAAAEVVGSDRLLLHAGPPFDRWGDVPQPVRNSLAFGAVYEGWASDDVEAESMLATRAVRYEPAQDHDVVVPLAGVCSPSMQLHVVRDAGSPTAVKYSVVNEGMRHVSRVGRRDPMLAAHHRWLNGSFAAWLNELTASPVELAPMLALALGEGDDCHSRTVAGSRVLTAEIRRRAGADADRAALDFLDDSPAFALNLWMAAAALSLAAAEGVPGSTLVTRAGGNGHEFGIQVACRAGHWVRVPASA